MKIAFDVKGTLEGPKGGLVRKLLDGLLSKGHNITVWSNAYFYATDHVVKNGLDGKVTPELKYMKSDLISGYEKKESGLYGKKIVGYQKNEDGTDNKARPIKENDLEQPIMVDDYSKPIYGEGMKDLAIEDDRSQTYLAAERLIFVDELTEDVVEQLIKDL